MGILIVLAIAGSGIVVLFAIGGLILNVIANMFK